MKTVGVNRLPTPFELTGDPKWDVDRELYRRYDLELEEQYSVLGVKNCGAACLNTSCDVETIDNSGDTDEVGGGVKGKQGNRIKGLRK